MQKAKELEEIKNTLTAREDFLQKQPKASKAKNKIQVRVCVCARARIRSVPSISGTHCSVEPSLYFLLRTPV